MAYVPQTTGVLNTAPQAPALPATAYNPAYGGIPQLPATTTDTTKQAGTDVQSQLIANLPNYLGMVGQATGNITNNLQGLVGSDVAANLGTQAAEFGAGSGTSLSPASATNFLAKYGLTSNALETQGQQQLLAQMQATPIQQTSTGQQTTDLAAQQAVYNSAPQPGAAAAAAQKAAQAGISAGRGSIAEPAAPSAVAAPTAGMGYGDLFGGAGGGGLTPDQTSLGAFGNMGQEWEDLFNDTATGGGTAAQLGYQPTSQGTMYMGPSSGYQEPSQQTGVPTISTDPYFGQDDDLTSFINSLSGDF